MKNFFEYAATAWFQIGICTEWFVTVYAPFVSGLGIFQ